MKLILASQSPRRRELLKQAGYEVQVRPANIEEHLQTDLHLDEALEQLAYQKAGAVEHAREDIVLAADTVVIFDHEILGKPCDEKEACDYLSRLSGETHQVKTGVCILTEYGAYTFTETTDVHFKELKEKEILDYVATGSPMDKAGAYGIQDSAFVDHISGSYTNVVGLPMEKVQEILRLLVKDTCITNA